MLQLASTQMLDALLVTWGICKGPFDYVQHLFARHDDLDMAST